MDSLMDDIGMLDEECMEEENEQSKLMNSVLLISACATSAAAALMMSDVTFSSIPSLPGKVGNLHRDRTASILTVRSWDDEMFRRQFRLNRSDFNSLLLNISPMLQVNNIKATNSSGSAISPELRLLVTLRILAGASYLDMIWYNVSTNHCMDMVVKTCEIINDNLNNISFPDWQDEVGYSQVADGWQRRMIRKFGAAGEGILSGMVSAGDGLAIAIREPTAKDLNGKAASTYMNRKGFFAVIAQAFCDAHCRFQYFDVAWPGSTGDCTAFAQCELFAALKNGMAPNWVLFALDEAYSSFGGSYLTPFSKSQLLTAKTENIQLYQQMRTFNHVLSSLRIHIERAFGQLVRRFGILWKALELRLAAATTVILCCARLHNLCVTSWMRDHDNSCDGYDNAIPAHVHVDHMELLPTNDVVMRRMSNGQISAPNATDSSIRHREMNYMYSAGIVLSADELNLNI